jgi:hypothetical protein
VWANVDVRSSAACYARVQLHSSVGVMRSIPFLEFTLVLASLQFPHKDHHFSFNDLQNTRTQKLTKISENNEAKGLANIN